MKFVETDLKGAFIIEPAPVKDERGMFARIFCKRDFKVINHTKEFVQINLSSNIKKGTVRGLHFQQKPHAEIRLIQCIRGSVFDVMLDLRANSVTFLKWFGTIISEENMKMTYIPEGFAHGFQTLEDHSQLLYHHTEYYTPNSGGGINPFDKEIGVRWPVPISMCSDRDKNLPEITKEFNGM
ncbi:MAG: dTDP-4-dehydrorhamnose 3,5-epimerase [Bacteroidetes bacterium]|nr:dTDP-4-dehydrorhamnose 3,5-epimerase [Bacteroidota bacterium]